MRCLHILKTGGFMDRVCQYIYSPHLISQDLPNDTAHAITPLYYSYR